MAACAAMSWQKEGNSKEAASESQCKPTKLFLGGLTRITTTKQLRDHFAQYGRVLDCVAMRQPDGRPRGFGYVTLDSSAAADRVLAVPQVVDGRVLDIKRAVPEGIVASLPPNRLHTPASRATPTANLNAAAAWPEMGCGSPFGFPFPMSPMNHLAQMAAMQGAWPWATDDSTPDVMDLLVPEQPESPLILPEVQAMCDLLKARTVLAMSGWPVQPAAASMSATAAEFVPAKVTSEPKRVALGEITNTMGNSEGKHTAPVKVVSNIVDCSLMKGNENAMVFKPSARQESKSLVIRIDEELEVSESLPSLGSADHAAGTCKRCNFYPKGRCQHGKQCTFCHLSHEKRKPSRQEKRERRAAWLASQKDGEEMPKDLQDDDDDSDEDTPLSPPGLERSALAPGLNPAAIAFVAPPPGLSLSPEAAMPSPVALRSSTWSMASISTSLSTTGTQTESDEASP